VLILVRHGQTAVNRAGAFQGRSDAALTDEGTRQARAAALAIRGAGVGRVMSSPLRRARETAVLVAAEAGCAVEIDDRLVELDYGEWEGKPLVEVSADTWARWRTDPAFAPPGGESLREVTERVAGFLAEFVDTATADPDHRVVAVSHVSPIKAAVCLALGVAEPTTFRMHLDLASITRIVVRGARPLLLGFNEVPPGPGA